jgi:hypothetical protein
MTCRPAFGQAGHSEVRKYKEMLPLVGIQAE